MAGKLFYFLEDSVKNCYLFFKWLLGVIGEASGLEFFFVSNFVITNFISPFVRGLCTIVYF